MSLAADIVNHFRIIMLTDELQYIILHSKYIFETSTKCYAFLLILQFFFIEQSATFP